MKKNRNEIKTVSEAAVCACAKAAVCPYVDKICANCQYLEATKYSVPYCRDQQIDILDIKGSCSHWWEKR